MLAETVTVSTTPTSIRDLIATVRGVDAENIPYKCVGVMFKYGPSETAVVSLTDPLAGDKPASAVGVTVLDVVNQNLISSSMTQFDIIQPLLSCDTGTVSVEIVVTQAARGGR